MPVLGAIEAVTFDVGGTLIHPHPSVGAVYAEVASRHGAPSASAELLENRFRAVWRRVQPFQHRREDWAQLVEEVFQEVPISDSRAFFDDLFAEFGRASRWRIYDDVIPVLEQLSEADLELGIISNWDDRLRPLLRELRLDRYFTCMAISCEAGFAKPSCVIFEEALRQLGRPAPLVLHVGDGLREDFAGATAAGMAALHLRRDAPALELQIQTLQEIWPQLAEGR